MAATNRCRRCRPRSSAARRIRHVCAHAGAAAAVEIVALAFSLPPLAHVALLVASHVLVVLMIRSQR
jgi:hypothetical protein